MGKILSVTNNVMNRVNGSKKLSFWIKRNMYRTREEAFYEDTE